MRKGLLLAVLLLFFAFADWIVFSEGRPKSTSFILSSWALDAGTVVSLPAGGGTGDNLIGLHTAAVGQTIADGANNNHIPDLNMPQKFASSNCYMAVQGYSTFADDIAMQNIYDIYPGATLAADKNTSIYFSVYSDKINTEVIGVAKVDVNIKDLSGTWNYRAEWNANSDNNFSAEQNISVEKIEHKNLSNKMPGYTFVFIRTDAGWEEGKEYLVTIKYQMAGASTFAEDSFKFKIAGVPFLTFIKEKEENFVDNKITMSSRIYGMSMAGGLDANGDGYADFIVADPYFQYSSGGDRRGIVYLYFGSPDKNLEKDVVFDNYLQSSNDQAPEFGYSVGMADINKDGYADVFIGHPAWGENTSGQAGANKGRILVYLGGPNLIDGGSPLGSLVGGSVPVLILTGGSVARLGEKFSVGDITGDGYADLLVIGKDPSHATPTDNKYIAKIFDGKKIDEKIDYEKTFPINVDLESSNFSAGNLSAASTIKVVGDVDKDGFNDFVLTYPDMDAMQSKVLFYRGQSSIDTILVTSVLKDPTLDSNFFGFSVTAGDLNGDGNNDIIVGCKRPNVDDLKEVKYKLTNAGDEIEYRIVKTQEGNETTKPMYSVTKKYNDSLCLVDGTFSTYEAVRETINQMKTIDNINNENPVKSLAEIEKSIILQLARKIIPAESKVFIYYGMTPMVDDYTKISNPPIDIIKDPYLELSKKQVAENQFGYSVGVLGDVDGDGLDDLFIGAPDSGEKKVGGVFIILGNRHNVDSEFATSNFQSYFIPGEFSQGHLGYCLAKVGDLDLDTYDDVILSSPGFDGNSFEFNGYPIEYTNSAAKHSLQYYANLKAVDRAAPDLVNSLPVNGQVGWDLDDEMTFVLADRGKTGIDLSRLSIGYCREGFEKREGNFLIGRTTDGAVGLNPQNITGDMKLKIFHQDGRVSDNVPLNSNFSNIKAAKCEIKFRPKEGILKESEKYKIDFDVRDNWIDPWSAGNNPIGQNMAIVSVNIGINQKIFKNMASGGNALPSRNVNFSSIGDINGDGVGDLAVFIEGGKKVAIYLGKPGLNPDKDVAAVIIAEPDYTFTHMTYCNFGAKDSLDDIVLVQQKNDGSSRVDILLGSRTFWQEFKTLFPNYKKGVAFLNKNNNHGFTDMYKTAEIKKDSIIALTPIHRRNRTTETVVFATDSNKLYYLKPETAGSYSGFGLINISSVDESNKIRSLAAGYLRGIYFGSTENICEDLVVGQPYAEIGGNQNAGKISIFSVKDGTDGSFLFATTGTNFTGTKKDQYYGWSLACGFFDDFCHPDRSFSSYYTNADGEKKLLNQKFAYEELAVGSPQDSSFGDRAGKVQVYYSIIQESEIGTIATNNRTIKFKNNEYITLKPEISQSLFGYSLEAINYLSLPEHYTKWSLFGKYKDKEYFDDAQDLIVGAPAFDKTFMKYNNMNKPFNVEDIAGIINGADANKQLSGKFYIYVGGSDFEDTPMVGTVGKPGQLVGLSLANLGDLQNTGADLIGISQEGQNNDQEISILFNNLVPDTFPPVIVSTIPWNLEYDVPTNASISILMADQSGITDRKVNIFRKGNIYDYLFGRLTVGEDWPLVLNGTLESKAKFYDIKLNRKNDQDFGITIAPSSNYQYGVDRPGFWGKGETVSFKFIVGDNRSVWVSEKIRSIQSLYRTFDYGFVADFGENVIVGDHIKSKKGEETVNALFGSSVASLGDINNDGYIDFMIGEPGSNSSGFNSGKVHLYLGDRVFSNVTSPDAIICLNTVGVGNSSFPEYWSSAKFGWEVAGAGDVNGDGYDDAAVVALNSQQNGGEVFVFLGNADPAPDLYSNKNKAGGDDVACWGNDYVHKGAISIQGEQIGDQFGSSLGTGGDINGDGYKDIVIGAPAYNYGTTKNAGIVYVIFGGKYLETGVFSRAVGLNSEKDQSDYVGSIKVGTLPKLEYDPDINGYNLSNIKIDKSCPGVALLPPSKNIYLRFGAAVLNDANIDGDRKTISWSTETNSGATKNIGIDEILISSTGYDRDRGKVEIFKFVSNDVKAIVRKQEVFGEYQGDRFGFSMASMGDISADDNFGNNPENKVCDDFVVGAPHSLGANRKDDPKYLCGAAYVYLGDEDFNIVTPEMQTYGQNAGDQFGYKVANVGNVDNDDYANNDILVAAPFFDKNYKDPKKIQRDVGRVYIFATPLIVEKDMNDSSPSKYKYHTFFDSYADFISMGDYEFDRFGISACYAGDIDGDFVPEYVIGAPNHNIDINANAGRAYLFTNPDVLQPELVANSLLPFDGQPDWLPGYERSMAQQDGTSKNVVVIQPISFKLRDDRVLDLASVMIRIEDNTQDYKVYSAFYKKEEEKHSFTVHSAKEADFYFYPTFSKFGLDYSTQYKVQVMASDKANNKLDPQKSNYTFTTVADPKQPPVGYIKFYDGNSEKHNLINVITSTSSAKVNMAIKDNTKISEYKLIAPWLNKLANLTLGVSSSFGVQEEKKLEYNMAVQFNEKVASKDGMYTLDAWFVDDQKDQPPLYPGMILENNVAHKVVNVFRDTKAPEVSIYPAHKSKGNPDDCDVVLKISDLGVGVSLNSIRIMIDGDKGNREWENKPISLNADFSNSEIIFYSQANYADAPIGKANWVPEVTVTINGMHFEYEENVSISVWAVDNTGLMSHAISGNIDGISQFSYQVSPDYRAPKPYRKLEINEGSKYTEPDGRIQLKMAAIDDTGVATINILGDGGALFQGHGPIVHISFDMIKDKLITLNGQNEVSSKSFTVTYDLTLDGEDREYTITVNYIDKYGNKSKDHSASIILDSKSKYNGPIMPTILVNSFTQKDTVEYINTTNVTINLFSVDALDEVDPKNPHVVAAIIRVVGNDPYDPRDSKFLKWDDGELGGKPIRLVNKRILGRSKEFLQLENFTLPNNFDGSITLEALFFDNDYDYINEGNLDFFNRSVDWLVVSQSISVGDHYKRDVNFIIKDKDNLRQDKELMSNINFCDNPASVVIYVDRTRPTINYVMALSGDPHKNAPYSLNSKQLKFSARFDDKNNHPLKEFGYRLFAYNATNNALMHVGYNKKEKKFNDFKYIMDEATYLKNAHPTKNIVTINGTSNDQGYILVPKDEVLVENGFDAQYAEDSDLTKWHTIEVPKKGIDGEVKRDIDKVIEVNVTTDMRGFFFAAYVKDVAGNYSAIVTSNLAGRDSFPPLPPIYNYSKKVRINRPIFDIDFKDLHSGLRYIFYSFANPNNQTRPIESIKEETKATLNINYSENFTKGKVVDYNSGINNFKNNWRLKSRDWEQLDDGEHRMFFRLQDSANNIWQAGNSQLFEFYKDTTPIPHDSIYLEINGKTDTKVVTENYYDVHHQLRGELPTKFTGLFSLSEIVTKNFPKDYSFENAGDYGIHKIDDFWHVSLNKMTIQGGVQVEDIFKEGLVTTNVILMEYEKDNIKPFPNSNLGLYALCVSFNVVESSCDTNLPWAWGGLQTTYNVGSLASTNIYSVGMLLHTYDLDDVINGETALVLKLQRGKNVVYSKPITNFIGKSADYFPLCAGVTGDSQIVTATLQFVEINNIEKNKIFGNYNGKKITVSGNIYIDAVFTQPDLLIVTTNMKNIDEKNNKKSFRVNFNDQAGPKSLYYMMFDKPGNITTGSFKLGFDKTSPNYVGAEVVTPSIGRDKVPWAVGIDHNNKDWIYFGSNKALGILAKFEEDHYSRIDYYAYQLWQVSPSVSFIPLTNQKVIKELGSNHRWSIVKPNVIKNGDYMYLKLDRSFPNLRKNGQYCFLFSAHNEANMWAKVVTADVTYNIDIDQPLIEIDIDPSFENTAVSPSQFTGWYSDSINVTINATDYIRFQGFGYPRIGGSGVREIQYQINTGNTLIQSVSSENCRPSSLPTLNIGIPTKTVTFKLEKEGRNYFAVTANDGVGNVATYVYQDEEIPNSEIKLNMLNIDRKAPVVSVNVSIDNGQPYRLQSDLKVVDGWSSRNVDFKIGFSDGAGVGTKYVFYKIDEDETVTIPVNVDPIGNLATPKMAINWAQADIPVTDKLLDFVSKNKSTISQPGYAYDENTRATTLRRKMKDSEKQTLYSFYPSPNEIERDKIAREEIDKLYKDSQVGITMLEIKEGYYDENGIARRSAIHDRFNEIFVSTENAGESILHYFKYDNFKFYDGYHKINVWAEDKFAHKGKIKEVKYVKVDRKAPEAMFNLGGNFQVEWSLATVNIDVRTYDLFNAKILVTNDYYAVIPAGREKTYTDLPGSGVRDFWYKIDSNNPKPDFNSGSWKQVTNNFDQGRWGLNIGNFANSLGYFVVPQQIVITANGLNTLQFYARDFAGIASPLVYGDPNDKVWDSLLNMNVYPSDKGIIREIKIDTLPPYDAAITMNIPSDDVYYLYTNKPDLQITVSAKDDGIGVRYAYIWCSENSTISEPRGLKINPQPVAPHYVNYYPVEAWATISYLPAKPVGAQVLNAGIDLPLNGTKGVWLRFGEKQGTRNIHVLYGDDFAMDYKVSQSYIDNGDGSWWGYTPSTMNNFITKKVTLQDGTDVTINSWYITKNARLDHRMATENRGSMLVVYDNVLDPGEMWMKPAVGDKAVTRDVITGEINYLSDSSLTGIDNANRDMHTVTVNSSKKLTIIREKIDSDYHELYVSHNLENELSGIRYVKVRGDVKFTADTYSWLPFKDRWLKYPKDTVNTLSVQIDQTQEDGYKNIMVDFIDIAGNIGGRTNFPFLYDKIMEFSDPESRVKVFEYDDLGQKVTKDYIVTTKSINLKLNFPGAWAYKVYGDIEDAKIVTGHYVNSGASVNVTLDATSGGEKTIYLKMYDLFFDIEPIAVRVFLDKEINKVTSNVVLLYGSHPQLVVMGQKCFYQGQRTIALKVSGNADNTLSGVRQIYIDGLDLSGKNQCLDDSNDGLKWCSFNSRRSDNIYYVQLKENVKDGLVTINFNLKDNLGNTTVYKTYYPLYFNKGMESSMPYDRVTILSSKDGKKISNIVDTEKIRITLDFPGAITMNVSGDVVGGLISKGYHSVYSNYIDVDLLSSSNFVDRTIFITMQDVFLDTKETEQLDDDELLPIEVALTLNLLDIGQNALTPNFTINNLDTLVITYNAVTQTVNYVSFTDQVMRISSANNSKILINSLFDDQKVKLPQSIKVFGDVVETTISANYFTENATKDFKVKLRPHQQDGFITLNVAVSDGLRFSKETSFRLFYDHQINTDNYFEKVWFRSNETGNTLSYVVDSSKIKVMMDFPGTYKYHVFGDIQQEVEAEYLHSKVNSFNIELLPGVGEKDLIIDLIDYGYTKRVTLNLLVPDHSDNSLGVISENIYFKEGLRVTYNGKLMDFVDKDDQVLVVTPNGVGSLMGIKDIYISGNVLPGANTFKWVSFNSGVANSYDIVLDSKDININSNGVITVNVLLRDAMGFVANAAVLSPLYDLAMQGDNPRQRIKLEPLAIKEKSEMPSWLSDLDYLVNTDNLTFKVDFPGSNYYTISGDIVGGPVSATYLEEIKFEVLPGEKVKKVYLSMHDLRTGTGFITFNIGYDDKVLPDKIAVGGMVEKKLFGTTVNYVNSLDHILTVSHNIASELSGVKHLMFKGDVDPESKYSNQWVPFKHGEINNYPIRLKEPAIDRLITVNVIYKDYALNQVSKNIVVFYDRRLQSDNPYNRFEIWSKKSNKKKSYLIDSPSLTMKLNFPGANHYQLTGDLNDTDRIVTGAYAQAIDVELSPTEGMKVIYLTLIDTDAKSQPITINLLMDSIAPSVEIDGIEKDVWYYYNKPFNIKAQEHVPSEKGAISSGIHNIYYRFNNGQTYTYEVSALNKITTEIVATLNVSGTNNIIEVWVEDHNGNISEHKFLEGYKLNVTPPTIHSVKLLTGSNNHVNKTAVKVQINASGTDRYQAKGDLGQTTRGQYKGLDTAIDLVLDGSAQGTKNIELVMEDIYTEYGSRPATYDLKVVYDATPPPAPIIKNPTDFSTTFNVIPDNFYIEGEIMANDSYLSNVELRAAYGEFQDVEKFDGNKWRVKMQDFVYRGGSKISLKFRAYDEAGNRSELVEKTLKLGNSLVIGKMATNIDKIKMNAVNKNDFRVVLATSKLSGVNNTTVLDKEIVDIQAVDNEGNSVHEFSNADTKLVLRYPSSLEADGIDPNSLRIFYLNELTNTWELVKGEQVLNKLSRTVSVKVEHFSIYKLFSVVNFASDLSGVRVFPNPYIGNDGVLENGEDSDPERNLVKFENLTDSAVIRIYTISGELVNKFDVSAASQDWHLKNMNGEKVASGIYIYLITDNKGNTARGRITVIR